MKKWKLILFIGIIFLIGIIILICLLNKSSNKIPKVIYQTYKKYKPKNNYMTDFLEKNQDFTYEFYDDDRCESFIKKNFDDRTLSAFQKLNKGAAKADLWRYCIMYKNGGVYLDLDSSIHINLDEIINKYDNYILYDSNYNLVQWIMMYSPNNAILKKTIEMSVDRIHNNEENIFIATGPTVLSDAFFSMILNKDIYDSYNTSLNLEERKKLIEKYKIKYNLFPENNEWFKMIYPGYDYNDVYDGGENERYIPTWNKPTPGLYK